MNTTQRVCHEKLVTKAASDTKWRSATLLHASLFVLVLASAAAVCQAAPSSDGQRNAGEFRTYALPAIEPSVFGGDVRDLPQVAAQSSSPGDAKASEYASAQSADTKASDVVQAAMPAPLHNFSGLSYSSSVSGGTAGADRPPSTNGDVGPNHYIQGVSDAYAIYTKAGVLAAAFTENSLWSGAATGTPCDANNRGSPTVLHDGLVDRWILTNVAYNLSGSDPIAPFYQCIAVSRTGDPIAGGWYLYAVRIDEGLFGQPPTGTRNDSPKFGLWTDCLYMASDGYTPAGAFTGAVFASFNRTNLYSGGALTSSIGYIANATTPRSMVPSGLLGTRAAALPPAGTKNYFVSQSQSASAFEVRKFTPGASCGSGGMLGSPVSVDHATYTVPAQDIPQFGTTNTLDSLGDRLTPRVQYRRVGSAESLWVAHSVTSSAVGARVFPQWAEIDVSAGTITTTPAQQQNYTSADTLHRWVPSLAADAMGNMAMGYSTSGATAYPSIAYVGRLASDPPGTLPQTEVVLIPGSGSQNNLCGGVPCHRWGEYTAMSVDPSDDCTFWYANQYYDSPANGDSGNWQTRIGAFKFPACSGIVIAHAVTPSINGNGTIAPSTPQMVNDGTTTTFALTPGVGYHIGSVNGTCGGVLNGRYYTTSPISANCTVIANFAIDTFTVTPSVNGGNGTIAPSAPQTVAFGDSTSFTLTPSSGYHIGGVTGTCTGSLSGTVYTTSPVTSNCTVIAAFAIDTYVVTPSVSGGNGAIAPSNPQTVDLGAAASFTLTPNSGYHIFLVGGTCGGTLTGNVFTTNPIAGDCSVVASFTADVHTVTPSVNGGNGAIAPSTPQTVNDGQTTSFTLTPNSGYHIAGVAGTCGGSLSGDVFTTAPITANCSVVASFTVNTFTVTPSVSGANGIITPSTPQTVAEGNTIGFTVTPDAGFAIAGVTGCGGALAGNTYTTAAITSDCTVDASFNPPSHIAVTGGSGQTAQVGAAFGEPLTVRVTDANATPVAGVAVNFVVHPAVNGAGAALSSSGSAITDATGDASVTATANGIAGDYTVVAGIVGIGETGVFDLTNVESAGLSISIDDARTYARYGMMLDYAITVHNSGPDNASDVSVSNALPAQLDLAQAHWICLGGSPGSSCTASGDGALADSGVAVPASGDVSWLLSAPVLPGSPDESVDNEASLSSASDGTPGDNTAHDLDLLVLLRTGFEDGDDGANSVNPIDLPWVPSAPVSAEETFGAGDTRVVEMSQRPSSTMIDTLVSAYGDRGYGFRVERLNAREVRVRLVAIGQSERATEWVAMRPDAEVRLGLVSSGTTWTLLLDGADHAVTLPVQSDGRYAPIFRVRVPAEAHH